MPITDPELATRILDCFRAAGVRFIVLHHEDKVGTADLTSDVDIALGIPIRDALVMAQDRLREANVTAALLWPYDIGGGASVFFTDSVGDEGAQIDALFDVRGRGRYGLRSPELFAGEQVGRKYPTPQHLDGLLYIARKAKVKGKDEDFISVTRTLGSFYTAEQVARRVETLFSSPVAGALLAHLSGRQMPPPVRIDRLVRSLIRIASRGLRPIGLWVDVVGPAAQEKASNLQARFGRWLVRSESGRRPSGFKTKLWWLRAVVPVRLRPGIYFSFGRERATWPHPDLVLDSRADDSELAEQVVAKMALRALQ